MTHFWPTLIRFPQAPFWCSLCLNDNRQTSTIMHPNLSLHSIHQDYIWGIDLLLPFSPQGPVCSAWTRSTIIKRSQHLYVNLGKKLSLALTILTRQVYKEKPAFKYLDCYLSLLVSFLSMQNKIKQGLGRRESLWFLRCWNTMCFFYELHWNDYKSLLWCVFLKHLLYL